MATAYQKRMMLRKQSDLTRLSEQYKKNIEAMTGQYESEFSAYQKQRDELMAPYEAAVKQYKEVQIPQYESATASYQQRLENFNQALANFQPKTKVDAPFSFGGDIKNIVQVWNVDGKKISSGNLPPGYSIQASGSKSLDRFYDLYRDNPVPTFSEKAPTAPTAPEAPDIPAFDQSKFEQQKTELQTGYQREVGERKGARLATVSRKVARPLLGGV